jgi:hypothetical protein
MEFDIGESSAGWLAQNVYIDGLCSESPSAGQEKSG